LVTVDVDTEIIVTQDADYNKQSPMRKREFDEAKIILRNSSLKTLQIQNTTEYLGKYFSKEIRTKQ
jgi:hypothetical protein